MNEYIRFVTSDGEEIVKDIVKAYGNKTIVTAEPAGHVANSPQAYPRAIIDVELLSLCDKLIITGYYSFFVICAEVQILFNSLFCCIWQGGSTYGFLAAMKSFVNPYYINGQANMTHCLRHRLSQPSITDQGFAIFWTIIFMVKK